MKHKWLIPGVMALTVLALAILFSQGVGQAQILQEDLAITKSVSPEAIAPDDMVIYTVTLSNTTDTLLEVDSLVDTLPTAFEYVGLAPGSEWGIEPWDNVAPTIQWAGPITVPASGSLDVAYKVYVPDTVPLSPDPYVNTVTAGLDGQPYETTAELMVAIGEASLNKTASPDLVYSGETVTYTITFDNDGFSPLPLDVVTDVLPAGVTFLSMTVNSDVISPTVDDDTLTWTGPLTIPADAELVVEYQAAMPVTTETLLLENQAWGRLADETVLGPASAEVSVAPSKPSGIFLPVVAHGWSPAAFAITKNAEPESFFNEPAGQIVVYTVVFANQGDAPGVLSDIRDTLPPGFIFVQMSPGSDITEDPTGNTGEIIWEGPYGVPGKSSLTLIYEVQVPTTVGTYVNRATATVSRGTLLNVTAAATVEVKEPILLQEEFENPSPHWEEFLNYWRLREEQWFVGAPGSSDDGSRALKHIYYLGVSKPDRGAHDALIMYKEPGAEQWTDYSYKVRAVLYEGDGTGRGQFGVWFRGTSIQEGQPEGYWVSGYYFVLQPGSATKAMLMQLRSDEECGDDCDYNYHFSNPLLLESRSATELGQLGLDVDWGHWYWLRVDVEGPQIRCYINNVLVFDYYDNVGTTFTEGTVGLFTYIAGDARFDHIEVGALP